MFEKLFNIQQPEPAVSQSETPKKAVKPKSLKVDAMKVIERLLDRVENVNNPKVDSLRKLYMHLQTNPNEDALVAFLKQSDPKPKKQKSVKTSFGNKLYKI